MSRPVFNDDDAKLNVRIPNRLLKQLKHAIVEKDVSLKEAVRVAVEAWLRTK
jgi:hypothetical protein